MTEAIDWVQSHDTLLWWLAAASVVMFFGTLLLLPAIVVRIPEDYFTNDERRALPFGRTHPVIRAVLLAAKNVLGVIFILAGLVMLLTPGQGLLCLVIGVMLLDFPGKFRLERWVVRRRSVHRAINWMRRRARRNALQIPDA